MGSLTEDFINQTGILDSILFNETITDRLGCKI